MNIFDFRSSLLKIQRLLLEFNFQAGVRGGCSRAVAAEEWMCWFSSCNGRPHCFGKQTSSPFQFLAVSIVLGYYLHSTFFHMSVHGYYFEWMLTILLVTLVGNFSCLYFLFTHFRCVCWLQEVDLLKDICSSFLQEYRQWRNYCNWISSQIDEYFMMESRNAGIVIQYPLKTEGASPSKLGS